MTEPRNRAVQVSRFGGFEGLEVADVPLPTAGRGEMRVRVHAPATAVRDGLRRRRGIDQLGEGVRDRDARYVVNGARPDPDSVLVSAGAEKRWLTGFALAVTFEGEFSGNVTSYAGKGVVKYTW